MTLIFCLKQTLTLEDDVDRNLFRVDTFPYSLLPIFVCLEVSNS